MCGIVGLYGDGDEALLDRMLACIRRRGPDGEGTFVDPDHRLAMGARRLSIVDLEDGSQPIANEDGSVTVVFNGEIYNHEVLRQRLSSRGHRFETRCDTEVLVHLWEEYGTDMPRHLEGMFAFSIWDDDAETLFLARDRLGIKPLFYRSTDESIRWGSELRPLLLAEAEPSVDERALYNYFNLKYTPSPQTMVTGIEKLPPGTSLVVTAPGDASMERYWDLRSEPVTDGQAASSARVRELLEQSVRDRLMGDVPVGAFLSGGLDSSAIVGLMAEHVDTERIQTFSVGFADGQYDESSEAEYVADYYGTDHSEITVDLSSFDVFGELVNYFGEPLADPAALPTMLLAEHAGSEVKTVLTGEGADELFAGYGYYKRWPRRRAVARKIPSWLFELREYFPAAVPESYDRGLDALRNDDQLILSVARQFDDDPATYLDTGADVNTSGLAEMIEQTGTYHDEYTKRLETFDLKYWLPDDLLYKVDHATMRASLEARVPFLSTPLVEYMYNVPYEQKVAGGGYKPILNRAVSDVVPQRVRKREKHGFDIPIQHWFRSGVDAIERWLSEENLERTPYITADSVYSILSDHRRGTDHGDRLWKILVYVAWYNELIVPHRSDA